MQTPSLPRPPEPKQRYPREMEIRVFRDPIRTLTRIARECGGVAFFRFAGAPTYLLSDPDFIKEVLVTQHQAFIKSAGLRVTKSILGEGLLTSEGEFHHRQKRLVQPAFHHQRVSTYAEVMVEHSRRVTDGWREGQVLDMHREMSRLTLSIVAKTLFNTDIERESGDVGRALAESLERFHRFNSPAAPLLERLPLPSNRRFAQAKETLDSVIYRIIQERRSSGRDEGDLLSMLLQARDSEGDGSGMSDAQLRDEAMTLFLAGHETTANALTWTWYLLSENPAVEAKLHEEVDSLLGGRPPTAADFPGLEYTNRVLMESMRVFPPAWILGREATRQVTIGGYAIPAGSTVTMSQYLMHHDPRFFEEPERFAPDRWTPEFRKSLPRFAYFPFGGGPRVCVGEPFAWMEGVLLIAAISRSWRMRHVPGHRVEMLPRITLRPKYGMRMSVEKRG